jgi:hypothetical protein
MLQGLLETLTSVGADDLEAQRPAVPWVGSHVADLEGIEVICYSYDSIGVISGRRFNCFEDI